MDRNTSRDRGSLGAPPAHPTGDAPSLLAEAKLAPPRRRRGMLERPRLFGALDAANGSQLTLVAAPIGYGKTSAVHAWCEARRPSLAWVNLDEGDNDPWRLWHYVATAVDRVREGLGRGALHRLRVSGVAVEEVVDELMNGIAAHDDELVVVLDDFQAVSDPECVASVDYALRRLPSGARLIIVTRSDPALRIAQLRARAELTEVRAHELAFTLPETQRLLLVEDEIHGLGEEELETLHEHTEGWPAALHLAALWLRQVDDPVQAVREFGGDHRFIADYLSQEVLAALDDDVRSFLLQTSVLGEFTADLCDDVFGRTDARTLLAELERSNLFVMPLEHGWFRIHSLFASFAKFQLASRERSAVTTIHQRAAVWFRERGLAPEAAAHANAAEDRELLAEILLEHHLALIRSGGERTLLRWLRTLPDDALVERPPLAAAGATAAVMVGAGMVESRRFLALVDQSRREHPHAVTLYTDAVVGLVRAAVLEGGVSRALEVSRRAVEIAERDADPVLVAVLAAYARALYFEGDLDAAWAVAMRAVEHRDGERRVPGVMFARTTLCLVAAERGHVASARRQLEAAASLGGSGSTSWLGATLAAARGFVLAVEGDLAAAERELGRAERFLRDEVATIHHAWALLLVARISCRRGRLRAAETALDAGLKEIDELDDVGRVAVLATEVEVELEQARARAGTGELLEPPSEAELAVLRLLGSSMSTRQLAGSLFLSPNTVRSHTRALYRKLGVHSRSDAVARATALGLIEKADSPG